MENIIKLSATQIGKEINLGRVCPIELTEAYLDKINLCQSSKSIFTTVMTNHALKQAHEAKLRVKNNTQVSLLDGVPISWKDLFDTARVSTEAGSALLKGRVPTEDAVVVKNVTKAGVISLAKTHMTELAFSGLGVNPITKTPENSINSILAPGGSSSGAAVSVTLNLVAGSIGSDTGGSVRVPAAWNNLVGLKTTHSLLNLRGVVPLCPRFDTVGPIVKSVEDATNFLSILLGQQKIKLDDTALTTKSFAVIETTLLENLDDEISLSFENSLDLLSKNGVKITRLKSDIISEVMDLSSLVFSPEAYGTWKDLIEQNPDKMHAPVLERFRSGQSVSGPTYVKAWQKLEHLREQYTNMVSQFDVTLAPTTAITPPKIKHLLNDDAYFSERNLLTLRNTRLANLMGLPALTLPTKTNFCGFMLMGKPFGENTLLSIGKSVETMLRNES